MARWLICVLAVLFAGRAHAADVTTLSVVEFGLFRAKPAGHIPSPQAVSERTDLLSDVVFYSHATKVPARLGIRFGTRFSVVGAPANKTVTLRSIWRIPDPGIVRPETGTVYRQSIADTPTAIGAITLRGYGFDDPWEIRCGDWVQEIWFSDRKLLSQTFTVEGCQGVPTSARQLMSVVAVRSAVGNPASR